MQSCAKSWGLFLAKSANPSAPCRHLTDKSRLALKVQGRFRTRGASACSPSAPSPAEAAVRVLRTSAAISSRQIERILPRHDDFTERHIGPGEREKREMLDVLGLEVRDAHSPRIKHKNICSTTLLIFLKHSSVWAILLMKTWFFPPFSDSRSTSWSKTRCQARSACGAAWKWMIQSVSLSLFRKICSVGAATSLCDAAGASNNPGNICKAAFLSHSPAAILPHEAGAE